MMAFCFYLLTCLTLLLASLCFAKANLALGGMFLATLAMLAMFVRRTKARDE